MKTKSIGALEIATLKDLHAGLTEIERCVIDLASIIFFRFDPSEAQKLYDLHILAGVAAGRIQWLVDALKIDPADGNPEMTGSAKWLAWEEEKATRMRAEKAIVEAEGSGWKSLPNTGRSNTCTGEIFDEMD